MTGRRPALLGFARLRAHLSAGALMLAVCQLMLVGATTALLATTSTPTKGATVAAHDECTCDHSTGVMCPMHRPTKTSAAKTRPAPPKTLRSFVSCDESAYLVVPGHGALAPPESIQRAPLPAADIAVRAAFAHQTIRIDSPPEPPPPRG